MGLTEYGLDPLHYGTAPAFSYDAMLKKTGATPELLHDVDMYMFLESGIRGGVATITHRLSVSDEKTKNWYTDCNNQYGWAMSQPLPYSDFKWLHDEEIDNLDVVNFDVDKETLLILEVDLKYPQELHDDHADYPLAPENIEITENMLSPFQRKYLEDNGIKFTTSKRLTPNLNDKQRYIIYIKNLQLYMSLGLQLTKIHKVLKFTQKDWLRPYIEFNTEKRKKSVSKFEKNFFKLLINSIFGKMMENVRRYRNVKMVHNGRQHALHISRPTFKSFQIISPDLVAVETIRPEIKLNKAIYAGRV